MQIKTVFDFVLSLRIFHEGIRFVCGGITTMCVCWGSCIVFVELFNLHYLISNNLATLIAWGYSYFINKYFVFKNQQRKHLEHATKFILLQAGLLGLTNFNLYILVSVLGFHYIPSIIGNAILMTLLNFLWLKFVVFGKLDYAKQKL